MSKGSLQRKVDQDRFDANFDRIFGQGSTEGQAGMLSLEQIVERLNDRKLTVVAEVTGLHYNTVYRVATGKIADPSYGVVKKLSDYLTIEG